ncbi:MAG: response regulator [Deltaproteobacteria bacterium]|nr:response regulator [Deltaproteobacteria bacterium]
MTDSEVSAPPSTAAPPPESHPIVIVEDDTAIGQLVEKTLKSHGYRTMLAGNADEALLMLAPLRSCILVVDKNLPGMTGLDLIATVRSARDTFEAILMTAFADVDSLTRSVELGIFRCMRKPFELSELLGAVAGAANRLYLRLDRRARIDELVRRNQELEGALARLRESETRRMLVERLASIGQFASSLAHEINNPLAYVRGNVTLLNDGAADLVHLHQRLAAGERWDAIDPDLRARVQRYVFELDPILRECSDGVKLIQEISRDLRAVSRYRHDFNEVFDLNDVVRTACRIARVGRGISTLLALDLAPGAMSVSGSTGRIAQVVMNLVMNARQASAEDRPNLVTIKTWTKGADIFLEVTDTGVGIPAAQLSSIFEPFVTFKEGGTGIGLSLVREIVTDHGGEVEARSTLGEGSTFRVRLPAAGPATIPPPSAERRPTSLPDGLEVLVIDCDASLRKVLARTMIRQRVRLADDPDSAMRLLQEQLPEVILCDLHMPGTDGVAFREQVCAQWPELLDRFVFISGNDELTSAARVRAPGCPFVAKPFSTAELELAIFSITRTPSSPPSTKPSGVP